MPIPALSKEPAYFSLSCLRRIIRRIRRNSKRGLCITQALQILRCGPHCRPDYDYRALRFDSDTTDNAGIENPGDHRGMRGSENDKVLRQRARFVQDNCCRISFVYNKDRAGPCKQIDWEPEHISVFGL